MKNKFYGFWQMALIFFVFAIVAFNAIKIEKAYFPYKPLTVEG